jgi:hypothetical protein
MRTRTSGGREWSRLHVRLAAFSLAVVVGHHLGTALGWLGGPGSTRWADWVDLAVPYAVVGCAAAALGAVTAHRREWLVLGAFSLLYTQGHGIHLAANSIGNVEPSDVVHLWDETVGHWLWYAGLAGIVAALALAVGRAPAPPRAWSVPLAAAFGLTIFTNSVEGGTAALGIVSGVVFTAWGVRARGRAAEVLVPAYALALVGLVAWGAYWRGFPQFSELGWI